MLSINMRIFKMVLLLFALFSSAYSLPLANEATEPPLTSTTTLTTRSSGDLYDQRQNGTENYRIHLDGLVFVVAPADSLLLAAGEQNLPISGDHGGSKPQEKPQPKPESDYDKPTISSKSVSRTPSRLVNFLGTFLRHIRPE